MEENKNNESQEIKEKAQENSSAKDEKKKGKEKISELEKIKKDLEEEKAKAEDFRDKWMRNVAEFDNYKKRNASLYQDAFNDGVSDTLKKIFPIGDNLDMALTMQLDEKTMEGIKLLKKKYDETLKNIGVTEIDPVGEVFDPDVAEAIMQAECGEGEESGRVKQVFQKGYKLKNKIIRYAKVSVIK